MILSHPSLQRDKIDETMEALSEANEDAREVDEAIRIGANVALGTDAAEADVEDELKKLIESLETDEKRKEDEEEARKVSERLAQNQVPREHPEAEAYEREKQSKAILASSIV